MNAQRTLPRYTCSRDKGGCEVFDVWDSMTRRASDWAPYWDSVDGEEEEAEQLLRELNLFGPRHVRAFDDVA